MLFALMVHVAYTDAGACIADIEEFVTEATTLVTDVKSGNFAGAL